uniref:Matrix protein n=1 Tax=Siamese algae-eater influenza-like virus TaxID=2777035 RepID=A0A866VZ08_9ORTO|nr:matrix protein [Siamese algae-eater influenza-like virus]
MSQLFEMVEAHLLALLPDGQVKAEIGEKLLEIFSGRCGDLESTLEWVKMRPLIGEMNKAIIGVAISLTCPKEAAKLRSRRFISSPLAGVGDASVLRKSSQLYEKVRKTVTLHEAMEIASGYSTGVIAAALGLIYTGMGKVSPDAAYGVICALCEKMADGHHNNKRKLMGARNPLVRHEGRMVSALHAARTMETLGNTSEHAEDTRELAERTKTLIGAMRSMGTGITSSNKMKDDVLADMNKYLTKMGMNPRRLV